MDRSYMESMEYMNYEQKATNRTLERVLDASDHIIGLLCAWIGALLALVRRADVRRGVRFSVVAACFFCFVGLIGSIEFGALSVGVGVVAGLFLIFVEIFCLS